MDLHHQEVIKGLAEEHGPEALLVLLGSPDPESAALSAQTVTQGDPTYAGPLAEVQLGLDVYHVLEDEVRRLIPTDVWDQQIGVMADVLEAESIATTMREVREASVSAPTDVAAPD